MSLKSSDLIERLTVTIPCQDSSLIFQITLNESELRKLHEERFFGITFRKEKYAFLRDLAEVLTEHILAELKRIDK